MNSKYEINTEVLLQAQACYAAMAKFRQDRERNKRYNYGDQWGDSITDPDGRTVSEAEALREQGAMPLKNNMIRRLVRNVLGVYSTQANEPRCLARDTAERGIATTMTALLRYNGELNRLSAVNMRTLEEFLISGLAVQRKWYGLRGGRLDCWTDMVSPSDFFIDSAMRDCRGWDCRCLGELHDVSFDELCSQFAASPADRSALEAIYGDADPAFGSASQFGYGSGAKAFLASRQQGMCRVIEVWRKEHSQHYLCHDPERGTAFSITGADYYRAVEAPNRRRRSAGRPLIAARWVSSEAWRYYFLAPSGHVLASGVTPYAHGGHPYVVKAYPLIDGEIHAFVADVIDQQKYTNRLITTYDWIIRSSAKGVLMIPEDCIPYGTSPADFAEVWSRCNGVIVYRPSATGDVPKQVASNSTNVGIAELLSMQLKFFEEISGVNSALEGKLASAGMSAALYGQQTQNATTALQDVLNSFAEFVRDGAYKDVRNMQQFYGEERVKGIVGADGSALCSDAALMRSAEFDLSIAPSTATPASRQASNSLLIEIWKSGQINLQQLLAAGDFPFADALRATLDQNRA